MNWVFQKTPPMGGATGEAFVNTLQATGMPADAVLAREAIQNSCDASISPNQKVKVVFRKVSLTGEEKGLFVRSADLINTMAGRKAVLGLQSGHCLDSLFDLNTPIHLLFIEDYGTHGLSGPPHENTSHFFRLLLSLGDSSKARETKGSGGSYGYGKSVYSANSRIHTVFAYSVFDKEDETNARLMGCSYFNTHSFNGISYSGRAWLGISESEELVHPVENVIAHQTAKELGFNARENGETGTSILIVDTSVEMEHLKKSIEDWWWPRLVENELDIVLNEKNKVVQQPRPKIREDLKPFIECYDLAMNRSDVIIPRSQKKGELNRLNNMELGAYGYTLLSSEMQEVDEIEERLGRIALIRSPKMVVEYMDTNAPGAIGVFVANEMIDHMLKLSEPAAHDKWSHESQRLEDENAKTVVKIVIDRLKKGLRNFAKDALPPIEKSEIKSKFLEKMLGNLFKPKHKILSPPNSPTYDPLSIRFVKQPYFKINGDKLKTIAEVRISLDPDYEYEAVDVKVDIQCLIEEDDGVDTQESIPVSLNFNKSTSKLLREHPASLMVSLNQDDYADIVIESEPYNLNWTTRINVQVSREVGF